MKRIKLSQIKTIPWIKELIPARTPEEQQQLQENLELREQITPAIIIDFDGEENILVDGHGRLAALNALHEKHKDEKGKSKYSQIICKVDDKLKTRTDIEEYMLRETLGRRNLTTRQRNYLMGSLANKDKVDKMSSSLTHEQIANIFKVETKTVQRALKYFKKINALVKTGADLDNLLELSVSALDEIVDITQESTTKSEVKEPKKKSKSKKPSFKLATQTKNDAKTLAEEHDFESVDELIAYALQLVRTEKENTINHK